MKFMAVSKLEVTGMLDELSVESRMIVYTDRVAYLGSSWVTRLFDGKQSVPLIGRDKAKRPKLQTLVAGRASATQTCTTKALPANAATWRPLLPGARTAWSPRR